MITDTKNILAIAAAIQPGEVLYKEVVSETVAKRCAS